jgi:hypothetical protein
VGRGGGGRGQFRIPPHIFLVFVWGTNLSSLIPSLQKISVARLPGDKKNDDVVPPGELNECAVGTPSFPPDGDVTSMCAE